jgi:hypothetical protein
MRLNSMSKRVNENDELIETCLAFDVVMRRGHGQDVAIDDVKRIFTHIWPNRLSESTRRRFREGALMASADVVGDVRGHFGPVDASPQEPAQRLLSNV